VSPWFLRRYRAERLLREQFERLQRRVTAQVSARLRQRGVQLDGSDLDACYSQAFQGLYAAALAGEEIADPAAWLTLVTFRRAIDEHRARVRRQQLLAPGAEDSGDLAAALDDLARLRQLFEGLRSRLSSQELQAASLCYLQGLGHVEAAARMGVSEARMRKLMYGRPGRPGVSTKVGSLLHTISGDAFCREQASLMRGLAYGVLDPAGERYQLAVVHGRRCPACRAYVLSLRGLAAALPPDLLLLHLALGAGASAGAGALQGLGAGAGTAVRTGAGHGAGGGGSIGAAPAAATGGVSAGGAFGVGAGGGWLLAGGSAGKLAAGCLLALGVGAGCLALGTSAPQTRRQAAGAEHRASHTAHMAPVRERPRAAASPTAARPASGTLARAQPALSPSARATREFGLEPLASSSGATRSPAVRGGVAPTATAASAPSRLSGPRASSPPPSSLSGAAGASAAAREFSPG
jgi:DNA-directed RNA polymerase specialized sigma24 family protein